MQLKNRVNNNQNKVKINAIVIFYNNCRILDFELEGIICNSILI